MKNPNTTTNQQFCAHTLKPLLVLAASALLAVATPHHAGATGYSLVKLAQLGDAAPAESAFAQTRISFRR